MVDLSMDFRQHIYSAIMSVGLLSRIPLDAFPYLCVSLFQKSANILGVVSSSECMKAVVLFNCPGCRINLQEKPMYPLVADRDITNLGRMCL